ncbi:MAG: hypothetical protein IKQ99_02000 [Alphaproteobacteria bacterium]|nr:hypothetical protein [Alphaproteobacteria bacterium]
MSAYKQKIKTLNRLRKFELVNRLFCYACVIPFFYTASCLNQKKAVPMVAKAGSVGFGASIFTALVIRNKEEKTKEELEKIKQEKENSYY